MVCAMFKPYGEYVLKIYIKTVSLAGPIWPWRTDSRLKWPGVNFKICINFECYIINENRHVSALGVRECFISFWVALVKLFHATHNRHGGCMTFSGVKDPIGKYHYCWFKDSCPERDYYFNWEWKTKYVHLNSLHCNVYVTVGTFALR